MAREFMEPTYIHDNLAIMGEEQRTIDTVIDDCRHRKSIQWPVTSIYTSIPHATSISKREVKPEGRAKKVQKLTETDTAGGSAASNGTTHDRQNQGTKSLGQDMEQTVDKLKVCAFWAGHNCCPSLFENCRFGPACTRDDHKWKVGAKAEFTSKFLKSNLYLRKKRAAAGTGLVAPTKPPTKPSPAKPKVVAAQPELAATDE